MRLTEAPESTNAVTHLQFSLMETSMVKEKLWWVEDTKFMLLSNPDSGGLDFLCG